VSRRRTTVAAAVAGAVVSLGVPGFASAQLRGSIDVGGASIRYGDSVRVTATTVAPAGQLDAGPLTTVASASISALGGGVWSSQAGITTSLLSPAFGVGRIELVGGGGGTMHQNGARTSQYVGRVRLHAIGATRGLWIGGGAGHASDGLVGRASLEGDLGAWTRHDAFTVLGTVRPVASADSVRFSDVAATIRRDATRFELAATAGLRSGVDPEPGSSRAWASLSAAVWMTPQLAVVADGGSYPADLMQGFPGGTYLSMTLRIAPRRNVWTRGREFRATESAAARLRGSVKTSTRVEVVARNGGTYAVRVQAPGARRVEIMGDFTDWTPIEAVMTADGWWALVTRITPGLRRMTIRVDGGGWIVPAGATAEEDEYGAPVGVVIVR